jgi:flavin-dependent dehydrogenase
MFLNLTSLYHVGIAGPAAAIFLKRAGYEAVIYEAMEEPDDYAGLFLNLARNGMRVKWLYDYRIDWDEALQR